MTEHHEGPTLADLLDFEHRVAEPLRARLAALSEEWGLPGTRLRASAVGKVVDRVRSVFATPVYKVLAAGWRMHPGCRAFCDAQRYPPGEAHVMEAQAEEEALEREENRDDDGLAGAR